MAGLRSLALWGFAAALAAAPSFAQAPFIAYRGIVNAASLAPPGLPQSGIARGSIFSIFGSNLGPATPAVVSQFPLTPVFEGVSVAVVQGGVSVSAIPIFVSVNQLNVILPSGAPLGPSLVRVGYQGRIGNSMQVEIVDNAPGLFGATSGGYGPGVVQNFVQGLGYRPVNTLDEAAVRGQVVTIYATGLGRVPFPDNIAPTPTPIKANVSVRVGEREATVLYAGRSPCCAGLDQIDIRVPDDAPLGCYVPIRVKAGNGVSNTVTIAIAAGASPSLALRCQDSFNPFTDLLRGPSPHGMIHLTRTNALIDSYNAGTEQNTTDAVRAAFYSKPNTPFAFDPYFSYPAPNSCWLQQTSGNVFKGAPLRGAAPAANALNAGPSLRLTTTSNGNATVPQVQLPQPGYAEIVGSQRASDGMGGLKFEFFNTTRIEGTGGPSIGASVGPFSAAINATNLFNWTERPTIDRVSRSFPFRAFFTPNDSTAPTVLNLVTYSAQQNASVAITCVVPPSTQSFVIPTDLLAHLPPSPTRYDGSFSMLGMGVVPLSRAVPFTANGIAGGLTVFSQWLTKSVYIQ